MQGSDLRFKLRHVMMAIGIVALGLAFHERLLRADEHLNELLKFYGAAGLVSFVWMPVLLWRLSWPAVMKVSGGAVLALIAGFLLIDLHPPPNDPAHFPSGLFFFGSFGIGVSACLGCLLKLLFQQPTKTSETSTSENGGHT